MNIEKVVLDPIFHEIPQDVLSAATLVEYWAKKNGWKHWRLNGIADRNLVEELEDMIKKRDILTEGILNYESDEED